MASRKISNPDNVGTCACVSRTEGHLYEYKTSKATIADILCQLRLHFDGNQTNWQKNAP
jgi:hypothetical protein